MAEPSPQSPRWVSWSGVQGESQPTKRLTWQLSFKKWHSAAALVKGWEHRGFLTSLLPVPVSVPCTCCLLFATLLQVPSWKCNAGLLTLSVLSHGSPLCGWCFLWDRDQWGWHGNKKETSPEAEFFLNLNNWRATVSQRKWDCTHVVWGSWDFIGWEGGVGGWGGPSAAQLPCSLEAADSSITLSEASTSVISQVNFPSWALSPWGFGSLTLHFLSLGGRSSPDGWMKAFRTDSRLPLLHFVKFLVLPCSFNKVVTFDICWRFNKYQGSLLWGHLI